MCEGRKSGTRSAIVMIRWTGLAPWEFEFPFPGSLTSTFLDDLARVLNDEEAEDDDADVDPEHPHPARLCHQRKVRY